MRHLLGSYTWRTNCVGWESLQRFIIKTFVTHFSGSFFTLLPFWDFNYIPHDCAALMWTETIAGTTWCDIISLISDFIFCQSTYQMITVTSDQTREKPKQCFHIKQKCVFNTHLYTLDTPLLHHTGVFTRCCTVTLRLWLDWQLILLFNLHTWKQMRKMTPLLIWLRILVT